MESILIIEKNGSTSYLINKLDTKRYELTNALQNYTHIGNEYLQGAWQECFFLAKEQVEKEHAIFNLPPDISWQQVFDTDYS